MVFFFIYTFNQRLTLLFFEKLYWWLVESVEPVKKHKVDVNYKKQIKFHRR